MAIREGVAVWMICIASPPSLITLLVISFEGLSGPVVWLRCAALLSFVIGTEDLMAETVGAGSDCELTSVGTG